MRIRVTTLALGVGAIVLVLAAGLRPIGFDPDSLNYAAILGTDFGGLFLGAREPTFWLIDRFSQAIPGDNVTNFFLLYALLGVVLKLSFVSKYSRLPVLSTYVYVTLYFVGHEMTQIRTGVAAGLYLYAIARLAKYDRKRFIVLILLAASFHYSAVVGLILLFTRRAPHSTVFLLSMPLLGALVAWLIDIQMFELIAENFLPGMIGARLGVYLELIGSAESESINLFNPVSMSYLLVYWILVAIRPAKLDYFHELLLISFGLGLAGYFAFSLVAVVAFRVMEFMSIGTIVLIANATYWSRYKQLWLCFATGWCALVFIVQSLILSLEVL